MKVGGDCWGSRAAAGKTQAQHHLFQLLPITLGRSHSQGGGTQMGVSEDSILLGAQQESQGVPSASS